MLTDHAMRVLTDHAMRVLSDAANGASYARQCGELEARLFAIRVVADGVLRLSHAVTLSVADLQATLKEIVEMAERRA